MGGSFFSSASAFIFSSSSSVQKHGYATPASTNWSTYFLYNSFLSLCLYGPYSPPTSGPSSHLMPSQARSRSTACSDSRVDLALSVSSTRRIIFPPMFFAKSQLKSAVLAPPTCSEPVGDGAKRTRTPPSLVAAAAASEETCAAAQTWIPDVARASGTDWRTGVLRTEDHRPGPLALWEKNARETRREALAEANARDDRALEAILAVCIMTDLEDDNANG
mmetsp:Transcript_15232/g.43319  ORF Transcript_15232/g.43319 Transcript_15232/m.43319 type:complete len:220 (+) Transcript_15232:1173-1832(+)